MASPIDPRRDVPGINPGDHRIMQPIMGRSAPRPIIALLTAALLLAATLAAAKSFPFEKGDLVTVEGLVTDPTGAPIPELEIVFEAAKRRMSLRPFGKNKKNIVQGSTQTDVNGEFGLEWNWAPKYNHYELLVTVRVVDPGGDQRLEILERIEVTDRVAAGTPVSIPVSLDQIATNFVIELREFKATLDSADQRKVYRDVGRPDRVDTIPQADATEIAWWYFELGKVYRFLDGRLAAVEDFEAVEPFPS